MTTQRDALQTIEQCGIQPGAIGHDAVFLLILGAPFDPFSRYAPSVLRHAGERHLPGWQHFEPFVADHADIDLTAVDELFGDRGSAKCFVDSFSTTDACEMPADASKNSDLTINGKRSRLESVGFRPGRTTVNSGTGMR